MTEQEKREKVINGLEQFIADFKPFCGNEADWKRVFDALALLKAQEPRVMTLWEAVGIIDRPVYLERNVLMPDKSVNRQECWALVQATDDEHMIRIATPYGIEKWHVGAYGIGWRCWTSQPTDAQREATPWQV